MGDAPFSAKVVATFANWGDVITAFALAGFFGIVRYMQDFVGPQPPAFSGFVAFAKIVTAAAVGLLTHWLCVEWHVSENMATVAIAVSGYGGAETLNTFKEAFFDLVRRKASQSSDSGPKG